MPVTVETVLAAVPIAVIATQGDIDASNYMELVGEAEKTYKAGIRNILLDLKDVPFISSSGVMALHSVALLLRGEQPLDHAAGWESFQAMEQALEAGIQAHVKLLNPQERVNRTLERTGLKQYFEIYTDRAAALASFRTAGAQAPTIT